MCHKVFPSCHAHFEATSASETASRKACCRGLPFKYFGNNGGYRACPQDIYVQLFHPYNTGECPFANIIRSELLQFNL